MTKPMTDADFQQGLLVKLELQEAVTRMEAEGIGYNAILSGIASLANDLVTKKHNQATASAWFFGMGKLAAQMAGREMFGPDGEAKH